MAEDLGRPGFGSAVYREEIGCPKECVHDGEHDCLFVLETARSDRVCFHTCPVKEKWREGDELEYERRRGLR